MRNGEIGNKKSVTILYRHGFGAGIDLDCALNAGLHFSTFLVAKAGAFFCLFVSFNTKIGNFWLGGRRGGALVKGKTVLLLGNGGGGYGFVDIGIIVIIIRAIAAFLLSTIDALLRAKID